MLSSVSAGKWVVGICVILAAGAALAYHQVSELIGDNNWVIHTMEVRTALDDIYSTLKEAESAARGYALSGKEEYLKPYLTASARVNDHIHKLWQLTADNTRQRERIKRLEPLVNEKIAAIEKYVTARRLANADEAGKILSSGKGPALMQEIGDLLDEMDAEEERLLHKRSQEAKSDSTNTLLIIASLAAMAVVIVAANTFLLLAVHRAASS